MPLQNISSYDTIPVKKCVGLPAACGCSIKNGKKCTKSVQNIFEFSDDSVSYSCSSVDHQRERLSVLSEDMTVNVWHKRNSSFRIIHSKFNIFQVENIHEVFASVRNEEDSVWYSYFDNLHKLNTADTDSLYRSIRMKKFLDENLERLLIQYKENIVTLPSDSQQLTELKGDIAFIMSELSVLEDFNKVHLPVWQRIQQDFCASKARFISMFGTMNLNTEVFRNKENTDCTIECAICISGVDNPKEGGSLPCGHTFHNTCIMKWIDQNPSNDYLSCPCCRQSHKVWSLMEFHSKRNRSQLSRFKLVR